MLVWIVGSTPACSIVPSSTTLCMQANLEIMMLDKRCFYTDEEQALQVCYRPPPRQPPPPLYA